ncbi:hypothetical protein PSH66_10875 [Pseudomonas sp. FP597]|uniref:Uncharacterized protein n=1 Tax=Pseudomonas lactucae TaxID=2813360 RepID=A0A9X1C6K4_9PSED|nr:MULTISPECIES: hypothetical protein [Pseudomonas]MBN2977180.1 hypothetical protein [Pseudomonas lactucae]MBN2988269.1 hypothetical protein [Pseudomonas lactucae]WLI08797.1 hypothetical protein PSH66_10875 [Pseudomonas sp. FP597]
MSDSLTSEALNTLRLPVVFTPDAWQHAVLLGGSSHPEKLQLDQLSNVVRAAFKAHLADPNAPCVVFEVGKVASARDESHEPLLQLSLSLLQAPDQPDALLIALAEEHQR